MIKKNLPIIEVPYGLASAYDDGIEVNKKLTGDLRQRIIQHEMSHRTGSYSKKDFMVDFQAKNSNFKESLKFALTNPEALIGFFPFMYSYHYKVMTYNHSAAIPFVFFGLIFSTFFRLLFNINFFKAFLGFSVILIIINIFLLILTHIKVRNEKIISKII